MEHDKVRPNTVIWFDSPEHYAEYLRTIPAEYIDHYRPHFAGGTFKQALDKLVNGDRSSLAEAQKIIDQMGEQQVFSLMSPTLVSDVVGFIPNVGNALIGAPDDMYNIKYEESESIVSPIRIFVETTVSAALTHQELINRGVACLALVLAFSMVRPVELYTASFGRIDSGIERGAIVRIPTTPIDLDRAVYMLAGIGFCRQLMFTTVNYQANYTYSHGIPFATDCRDICKCEDHDILIKGGHLSDNLMLNDPIKWVKQMIEKHNINRQSENV